MHSYFDDEKKLLEFTTCKKMVNLHQEKNITLYKSETLLMHIERFLPGNVFLGILSYVLISLFLFTIPNQFEN